MEMINALGRRKSAVARVFLTEGTGKITINKRDLTEYFSTVVVSRVRAKRSALPSLAHSLRSTPTTRRRSALKVS